MIEASLMAAVVFTLFMLALVNEGIRRYWPTAALTRAELLFIYLMQGVSVGIAGLGQIQFLNQVLGAVHHYATPENGWTDFLPYVPSWWVPDPKVLPAYYGGGSTFFTAEHLAGWLRPIGGWTAFILLQFFGFLCLNTILRRHWVEGERLSFPLVQLPLELTQKGATGSLLARRAFWLAFLLVCAFRTVSALHRVEPSFPEFLSFGPKGQLIDISSYFSQPPWSSIGYFQLSFHPLIIGITYLLPLDVSFSAWFFYLFVKAENILVTALGLRASGGGSAMEIPYNAEQGAGAFLAITILSFWGARRHLSNVWSKAIGRSPEVNDSDEALSYRTAVFGLIATFFGLVLFAALGGLRWYIGACFFGLYLIMITACTRLRAEAGPMLSYGSDMNPHQLMTQIPGTRSWDVQSLTPFAFFLWFDSDYRTVAMPAQMEAMKMTEASGPPLQNAIRLIGRWMLVAAALASISAFVSVLAIYYHHGAATGAGDNDWRVYNGRLPFTLIRNWLDDSRPPNLMRLAWIGVGVTLTMLLAWARSTLLWWPFHPAGFALAQAGAAMQWVWFAMLLGWGMKLLILRYGGIRIFRQCMPFFMGLIIGDVVIASFWSIVGILLDTRMYMFFPG